MNRVHEQRAYTVPQAAQLLGLHRSTLWRNFIKTGRVQVIAGLGRNRIPAAEIDRLLGDVAPAQPQRHQARIGDEVNRRRYARIQTVLNEAYKDALDILSDVLPEEATVEAMDKIRFMTAFRAMVPRPIDDESKRCCDRCGKPRGEMWVIHPYFWCWFMPLTEWRSDICFPCFKKVDGVKEWLQANCPELVCK